MAKAKKIISEIERGVGYLQGFLTNLMEIVREKNVPFEAIYRLATPDGRKTIEKMVDAAHSDWLAEQPKPRAQTGSPYRGGVPSGDALERITVPNLSAAELVAQAQSKRNLTYLNPDLAKWGFVTDEAGKTYEVMVWAPGRNVSTDDVRKHFPEGFHGNTAAFIAWVTAKNPEGYHASIPEDDRLFLRGDNLCAPHFNRGDRSRDLRLFCVDVDWSDGCRFVAFREVK